MRAPSRQHAAHSTGQACLPLMLRGRQACLPLDLTGGQVTVETAVLITLIVAGIAFMAVYSQRAMQGNLFATTQSVGSQFDPRDTFDEVHRLNASEVTQQVVKAAMVDAELIKPEAVSSKISKVFKVDHPTWVLESLPTGPVAREPAFSESTVNTFWDTKNSVNYNDAR